jgi:hypothetical protein
MAPPIQAQPLPYEFTPAQNEVVANLAYKMRGVGFVYFVLGLLSVVGGVLIGVAAYKDPKLADAQRTVYAVAGFYVVSGLINVLIGNWTFAASRSFKRIVDTKGNDIGVLMDGFATLHKVYSLLYTLMLLGVVVFLAMLVVALVAPYALNL